MKTVLKIMLGVFSALLLIRLLQIAIDCAYEKLDRKYILTDDE